METVWEYIARFYMISAKTEWNDDTLVAIYYKGLKDYIKDKLLKNKASRDMKEIVKKAIKIDGYLKERRIEKRNQDFI